MKIGDILILGFVVLWLILVFYFMKKRKDSGRCFGCGGCDGTHCASCADENDKKGSKK